MMQWPKLDRPAALALGTFDGVHLGHQALLRATEREAARLGVCSAALTFRGHPAAALDRPAPALILTPEEKRQTLLDYGLDEVVLIGFDKEVAAFMPAAFVEQMLRWADIRHVVVGYNFRFGCHAAGTPEILADLGRQYGFGVTCVPRVEIEGQPVSSTGIRQLIQEGQTLRAARWMGRAYGLSGKIERGKQLGRTLGFPTVNLSLPAGKVKPAGGVYTSLLYDGTAWRPGVTNVGLNPTVSNDGRLRIETFVMDEGAVPSYGAQVRVALLERLRGERKFESVQALRDQVEADKAAARAGHDEKKSLYFTLVP